MPSTTYSKTLKFDNKFPGKGEVSYLKRHITHMEANKCHSTTSTKPKL